MSLPVDVLAAAVLPPVRWLRVGMVRPDGRQSDGLLWTAADGVLGCGGHCHIVAADSVGGLWCSPLCVDRQAVRMSARVDDDVLPSVFYS